jgi:hypothetical protein
MVVCPFATYFFSFFLRQFRLPGNRFLKLILPSAAQKQKPQSKAIAAWIQAGAEGGTWTPMWLLTLDPEPSASTSSATSAQKELIFIANYLY